MYQRAENLIRRLSLGRKAKYDSKMLNQTKYENYLIKLGIENQEDRNEIIQSLYNLVLIVINSISNEEE